MDENSLIEDLKTANKEKDEFIGILNNDLTEKEEEIKRLWRYIEFLKLRGGE